jgi:hypothetical protein
MNLFYTQALSQIEYIDKVIVVPKSPLTTVYVGVNILLLPLEQAASVNTGLLPILYELAFPLGEVQPVVITSQLIVSPGRR